MVERSMHHPRRSKAGKSLRRNLTSFSVSSRDIFGFDHHLSTLDRRFSGSDCQLSGSDHPDDGKVMQTMAPSVTQGYSSRIVLASAVPCRIEVPFDDAFSDMPFIEHDGLNRMPAWQRKVLQFIEGSWFEKVIALLVVLNALALGYDANYMASHGLGSPSPLTRFTETLFCLIFAVELILRIAAFGKRFFTMPDWRWNWFDTALVSTQVFEQMLLLVLDNARSLNLGLFRMSRLLRVFRITRLLRTFHLFDELRALVNSMRNSIVSLLWSMVLLLVLMYASSVVFLESVAGNASMAHDNDLTYWFSSLSRTLLTMFECIVGGVSWDEVVSPLMAEISPLLGLAFCVYIAGCLFALTNMVTGVFVQNAITSLREDKDLVMAERIKNLFFEHAPGDAESTDDEVTWEIFQQKLEMPTMKDYFHQINVDISEAQDLFQLMDVDGSGSLSSFESVRACLRFRGPARSLELAIMMKKVLEIYRQVHKLEEDVKQVLLNVNVNDNG